ncbi:hypothetical protein Slin14017_G110850 [Septoria linicola]|nr:hypothetical protein Slin14017_G110850 [Septoria linicola]
MSSSDYDSDGSPDHLEPEEHQSIRKAVSPPPRPADLQMAIMEAPESQVCLVLVELCVAVSKAAEFADMRLRKPTPGHKVGGKRKSYDRCGNCGEYYTITDNAVGDCLYHEGEREFDYESETWHEHDWRGGGRPHEDFSDDEDYAGGFRWTCCKMQGDAAGCVISRHVRHADPVLKRARVAVEAEDAAPAKDRARPAEKRPSLSGVCYFLDVLPEELRVQVYEYVLIGENGNYKYPGAPKATGAPGSPERILIDRFHFRQLGLLATCKEIRAVASPIYYDKNKFFIDCRGMNPTAAITFSQHALRGSNKPYEIDIMLELGVAKADEGTERWFKAHYDGKVICRPTAGAPKTYLNLKDFGTDSCAFIGCMFDNIDTLKEAGVAWEVIEKTLEDTLWGSRWLASWSEW